MPLRKPKDDETQQEFMAYCMRELAAADTERPLTQRVAICLNAWRDKDKKGGYDPEQPRTGTGRWRIRQYRCPACGHRWGETPAKGETDDEN